MNKAYQNDKIKETRTYIRDNAIIRVHIPDLTPEERERRMENVKKAAAELLMEVERNRQKAAAAKNNNEGA